MSPKWELYTVSVFLIVIGSHTSTTISSKLPWSLFSPSNFFPSNTTSNLQAYARQKLSTLRHLRNKLNEYDGNSVTRTTTTTTISPATIKSYLLNKPTTAHVSFSNSSASFIKNPEGKPSRREETIGSLLRNMDNFISFTSGPLRKMITSKQGIESFASMVMPKREVLKKLLDIKGHLEPSLKRYLTDKYNGFLTSLVPYSENIGVPPFVLNSMKIPQDFDPRWQFIESLLESKGGIEKFLHTIVNSDFEGKFTSNLPEKIESRSADETELISDQEPDAMGQGYRKQQQLYLSTFKRRLMKPNGGKVRLMQQQIIANGRPSLDYDALLDQTGQYGHVSYDMRSPDEMMSESYYSSDAQAAAAEAAEMDLVMSASGGRGHGHGYGHSHGHPSYGGFLDPFTILGGLAFLTYLGLMLQNSLNRNNGTVGRSYNENVSLRLPVVPITLKSALNLQPPRIASHPHNKQKRGGRSLITMFQNLVGGGVNNAQPSPPQSSPITIDRVLKDISELWEEINYLKDLNSRKMLEPKCLKFKQCKIVWKMRTMNLEPVFATKLKFISAVDPLYFKHMLSADLRNLCEPYRSPNCK